MPLQILLGIPPSVQHTFLAYKNMTDAPDRVRSIPDEHRESIKLDYSILSNWGSKDTPYNQKRFPEAPNTTKNASEAKIVKVNSMSGSFTKLRHGPQW